MHERTTIHRPGRGLPVDDERARLVANWQATHRLGTPEVGRLLAYAAGHNITFGAALDELRRARLTE